MPDDPDVRWRQRFQNFTAAYAQLRRGVDVARQRDLSELEQQGLIKAFEFTYKLGWNVLKDYLEAEGIIGSRGASREAFQRGLVEDGETWMETIKARILSSHTFDCAVADVIAKDVIKRFEPVLAALEAQFRDLADSGLETP